MATRGKKKPAKRKAQGVSKLNRGLSVFGWIASAAVAAAWVVSDGRPARIASETLGHIRAKPDGEGFRDRVAALIREDDASGLANRSGRSRAIAHPAERTAASAHPASKPQLDARKDDPRVPLPASAPLLPFASPPLEYAMRQPRPLALPSTGAPIGQERHATRALAAHVAPDAASATLAAVESGSPVQVLRSAGEWRYVRNGRSGVEGWVDGRFLAGEAMSADLATLAQQDLLRRR